MSAEVITIGTELLHGLVRDTNSGRIVEQLASIGVEVLYLTTVGDDTGRMAEIFRAAAHRAKTVVTTGGLGPTSDDVTRKAIATVFRRRLILDEAVLDRIRARFRERGIDMPAMNESQALVPKGAIIIENPRGSAPGLHLTHLEADFFCLPGVPSEAEAMMEQYVLPYLRSRRVGMEMARRVVRTIGISESSMAERLQKIEAEESMVKIGYLPHSSGVDITLAAAAPEAAWVLDAIERCERRVKEAAGEHVYGGGQESLSAALGAILVEQNLTIATAESFTGGAIGAAITETPGASRYYMGGVVAYSNRAKLELLGVKGPTLERHGAVSAEVAAEMASGARKRFECDLALSSTGIAGPEGGTVEKPVGLVYLGLATREGTRSSRHVLGGTRSEIIARSAAYALDLARRQLALSRR
jgi:competence/damage-inducible protein CinA-like protein